MNSKQPTVDGEPFGYTFPGVANDRDQRPTGPPLLDNNETDILQNFFDNPNNVDPSFITMPQYHDHGTEAFGNHTMNWMTDITPPTGASTNSGTFPITAPVQEPAGFENLSATMSPSEEVYAAARFLHDSQGVRSNGPRSHANSFDGSAYGGQHSRQLSMQQNPNYPYPQPPSYDAASFNYPNPASTNGFYSSNAFAQTPGSNQGQTPRRTSEDQRNALPNSAGAHGPLKFGSDEKFHDTNYAGSNSDGPDRDLKGLLAHSFIPDEGYTSNHNSGPDSPTVQNYKRRRRPSVSDSPSENESYHSDIEADTGRSHKRRKSTVKDEEGDYQERTDATGKGKSKSGRALQRSQNTTDGSTSLTTPPGKSKKTPPLSADSSSTPNNANSNRPARENLSEAQKRSNHIQSERKRRTLIKKGFEDINRLVPELRTGGFSKSNMLVEAAKFMRELEEGNAELRERIRAANDHR